MCKAENLTTSCELSKEYGILNISLPYMPARPFKGTDSLYINLLSFMSLLLSDSNTVFTVWSSTFATQNTFNSCGPIPAEQSPILRLLGADECL
jgi:hypothetical protein